MVKFDISINVKYTLVGRKQILFGKILFVGIQILNEKVQNKQTKIENLNKTNFDVTSNINMF